MRGRPNGGLADGPSPVGVVICAVAGNVATNADSATKAGIAIKCLRDIAATLADRPIPV
jgi:hypothetical protein